EISVPRTSRLVPAAAAAPACSVVSAGASVPAAHLAVRPPAHRHRSLHAPLGSTDDASYRRHVAREPRGKPAQLARALEPRRHLTACQTRDALGMRCGSIARKRSSLLLPKRTPFGGSSSFAASTKYATPRANGASFQSDSDWPFSSDARAMAV